MAWHQRMRPPCRVPLPHLPDLDRRYPGIRFRIVDEQGRLRQHMRVFVNRSMVRDLETPIAPTDELVLMQALSGG